MKARKNIQWKRTLVLAAMSGLLASCGLPPGMKLLHLRVYHGGECVLETDFDVPDTSTVSEIWDAAGQKPFNTQSAAESLGANKANPLEAKLSGPVEIRISHPASDEISAKLTNLTLQRSSRDSDDWHLPAQEVSLAKKESSSQTDQKVSEGQLERLKSLVGDWYLIGGNRLGKELEPDPDAPFLSYSITSGGHCVVEKLFVGQPKEMTTVYHLANARLAMTHYCSLGNQPYMVAIPSGDNEIVFRLVNVGNMPDENDLHISSHSLEFKNADELTAHWGTTRDKKPASTSLFRVQRR